MSGTLWVQLFRMWVIIILAEYIFSYSFSSCFIYSFLPISSYLDCRLVNHHLSLATILHASCTRLMTSHRFCRSSLTKLRLAISTVENHPPVDFLPAKRVRISFGKKRKGSGWESEVQNVGLLLMMDNDSGTLVKRYWNSRHGFFFVDGQVILTVPFRSRMGQGLPRTMSCFHAEDVGEPQRVPLSKGHNL